MCSFTCNISLRSLVDFLLPKFLNSNVFHRCPSIVFIHDLYSFFATTSCSLTQTYVRNWIYLVLEYNIIKFRNVLQVSLSHHDEYTDRAPVTSSPHLPQITFELENTDRKHCSLKTNSPSYLAARNKQIDLTPFIIFSVKYVVALAYRNSIPLRRKN